MSPDTEAQEPRKAISDLTHNMLAFFVELGDCYVDRAFEKARQNHAAFLHDYLHNAEEVFQRALRALPIT